MMSGCAAGQGQVRLRDIVSRIDLAYQVKSFLTYHEECYMSGSQTLLTFSRYFILSEINYPEFKPAQSFLHIVLAVVERVR